MTKPINQSRINPLATGVAPRRRPASQLPPLQRAAPLQRGRRPLRDVRVRPGLEDGTVLQVQGALPQAGPARPRGQLLRGQEGEQCCGDGEGSPKDIQFREVFNLHLNSEVFKMGFK